LILNRLQFCTMDRYISSSKLWGALLTVFLAGAAAGQVSPPPLAIKSIAEVETKSAAGAMKLVPADRLVPGDRVIYTLEVRNTAESQVDAPSITYAIPEHMQYVPDSAIGPGATVSYSVDGGQSFARAENLKVLQPDGRSRPAAAADYTGIRWQLQNPLKANSVAFVRFRAFVK
jgi:uncharacterized repeat protein (TIGR01451 family)